MSESALKKFIASDPAIKNTVLLAAAQINEPQISRASRSSSAATSKYEVQNLQSLLETKEKDARIIQDREPVPVPPMPSVVPLNRSDDHDNELDDVKQNVKKTKAQIKLEEFEMLGFKGLWKYFHLPIEEACREAGVDLFTFNRLCKKNGIGKWPYKAIAGVNMSMFYLEEALRLTKPSIQTIESVNNYLLLLRSAVDDIVTATAKSYFKAIAETRDAETEHSKEIVLNRRKNSTSSGELKKSAASKRIEQEGSDVDEDLSGEEGLNAAAQAHKKKQSEMYAKIRELNKCAVRFAKSTLQRAGVNDSQWLRRYPAHFYMGRNAPQNSNDFEPVQAPWRLKKGWMEEMDDGRPHVHRLPVRDELLDSLGTKVNLRTLVMDDWHGFEKDCALFATSAQAVFPVLAPPGADGARGDMDHNTDAQFPPLKRGRMLCHAGEVVLPPLELQDTSDINKEGLTIILVEPQIFHQQLSKNNVDFIPRFALGTTRDE